MNPKTPDQLGSYKPEVRLQSHTFTPHSIEGGTYGG